MFDGGGRTCGQGEVADLAAEAGLLAVVVAMDLWETGGILGRGHCPDAVEHDRGLTGGGAERQVQQGAEMIFELRGFGAFDGPVTGVVDAWGHFVGDEFAGFSVVYGEKLDGEDADVLETDEDGAHVALSFGLEGVAVTDVRAGH